MRPRFGLHRTAQNFALLCPSPQFSLFLLSFRVFSLNFGGVFEAAVLGLSGVHTKQTPPKFHRRTPRERRKKEKYGGRGKTKSEIAGPRLWAPPFGPTSRGHIFRSSHFGLRGLTVRGFTFRQHVGLKRCWPKQVKRAGLKRVRPNRSLPPDPLRRTLLRRGCGHFLPIHFGPIHSGQSIFGQSIWPANFGQSIFVMCSCVW